MVSTITVHTIIPLNTLNSVHKWGLTDVISPFGPFLAPNYGPHDGTPNGIMTRIDVHKWGLTEAFRGYASPSLLVRNAT